MQSVKNLKNLKGKYVLVRADFNLPLDKGKVLDDFRIRAALPTIELLRKKGARIILISHIGRDSKDSLLPVCQAIKKFFPIRFVPEVLGPVVEKVRADMHDGDIILLENLRSNPAEKAGDSNFAKTLASYADLYVNEAFPVSHREDASIVKVPRLLPAYAGLQLEREVKELSKALKPKHPFLFILGGAKAETKLPLLKKYLKTADHVFIGGILANDFFKAQGFNVGKSKIDTGLPSLGPILKNKKLIIPNTVIVDSGDGKQRTVELSNVGNNDRVLDIGIPSIDAILPMIQKAKLILWNGPMGWYEGGYTKGTEELLKLLSKAKGTTIIGGGDTSVLVERQNLVDTFTFVSTGGGATLDFLAKGTLPGIKALGKK